MKDSDFIRGKVPMTKSEVRAVVLSKLELLEDSVLYDVGAGTGSVSVEASRFVQKGAIFAIEQKEEALQLIQQNLDRFHIESVHAVPGRAPEVLHALPTPSHAFIGGSTGSLAGILDLLLEKNPDIRVVMTMVTLETISQTMEYLRGRGIEEEIVSIQVARAEKAGRFHLMQAQNPVYILSFGGKELFYDAPLC